MKIRLTDEVLLRGEVIMTDTVEMELRWGDYFPAGFARIEAILPNKLSLIISDPIDIEVDLASDVKVPLFLLDGKKITGFCNQELRTGQKFQVHFIYDRKYYVTRQTIEIVPETLTSDL